MTDSNVNRHQAQDLPSKKGLPNGENAQNLSSKLVQIPARNRKMDL